MVLVDYDCIIRGDCCEEGTATLFRIADREVWIPNSQIEDYWEEDRQVEVPEWFAVKEELI